MPINPATKCGLISALLLSLASCATAPNSSDDTQQIRGLIDQAAAMNNQGDIDGWVALFEAGAVYMPAGMHAVSDRDELREMARSGFTEWQTDIQISPDEIILNGDWAFARSSVTGTVEPMGGGEQSSIDLKQIVIYHRQADGSWKIARLISNKN
ncbi:MAG: nuclear transport factor 2 family protein [Planctomycetes bacterium]|nr:nuclear transport factor 2 family protein [Planctomycetota bacterium]